ncbi:hypothetical protein [Tardiphaga sp.]|uniref:hypothetical protein n=1 Tax=Tardiphaga sp. TaxID=1926292 RepID=UPI0026299CC0|nr:hypothetical protein [Tardiphaga sp.]MDB5620165.1 hypothetical protein [Tardiphaga sp.]
MRYELRLFDNGWVVWDFETNAPAALEGKLQEGLGIGAADDAANLLNAIDRINKNSPPSFSPPEEDLGGGDICSLEATPSTEDDKPLG